LNLLLAGQNAKIGIQLRRRPIYDSPTRTTDGLAAIIPTAAAPATNQAFPLLTGMRRTGSRNDLLIQFHVHL